MKMYLKLYKLAGTLDFDDTVFSEDRYILTDIDGKDVFGEHFSLREIMYIILLESSFCSRKSGKKYRLSIELNKANLFNVYIESFGALSGIFLGKSVLEYNLSYIPDLLSIPDILDLDQISREHFKNQ